MKKVLLYIVLVASSFVLPLERADIAKLQPIEAIGIHDFGGQIIITTDTGDLGAGKNAAEALNDLIENTPGIVYLDTAEYLLVTESMTAEIKHLQNELKKSVKLCLWDGDEDLKCAVKYLSVHGKLPQLKDWSEGYVLPTYYCEKLSQKMDKSG